MSFTRVWRTSWLAMTRLWYEAAALRRVAAGRVRQYSLACSSLTGSTGPATRTWRWIGRSQCRTAAACGLAASSAPLSLVRSVKKASPRWRPRSITIRAAGMPSAVAVAMVMASGIGSPALRAASSHAASCRNGSASRSMMSTRSVLPHLTVGRSNETDITVPGDTPQPCRSSPLGRPIRRPPGMSPSRPGPAKPPERGRPGRAVRRRAAGPR